MVYHTFEAEYAKSSMAACRVCKAKIPKGSVRIGHVALPDSDRPGALPSASDAAPEGDEAKAGREMDHLAQAMRWHHFECFPKMKGARWMSQNVPTAVDGVSGISALSAEDRNKVGELLTAIRGEVQVPAQGKRKAHDDSKAGGAKRAKASSEPESAAASLARLTSVQGVLGVRQFQQVQKHEAELAGHTLAQMAAELAKNEQVKTGKKDELVQRIAEGRVLGALPLCPKCTKGKIKWSRVGGIFSCPGGVDEDGAPRRCNFRATELERPAWKT
eukprot:NODE_16510_length_990_cov_8.891078.p1 GENE.NODE_16510_length_990_cov_8.891078~~NODE_16510_length_990_cov_8.891078.p1  ORF type:complete len:274 (+),score=76.32 NODE_16510_length_990_cov_8.891078:97-918(+)